MMMALEVELHIWRDGRWSLIWTNTICNKHEFLVCITHCTIDSESSILSLCISYLTAQAHIGSVSNQ